MKGQTQAVTAVMITGIVVGAIASTYVWGVPLVEKRQSQAELQQIESKALDLEETIRSTARGGGGNSQNLDLELGNGEINVVENENYIEFTYFSENAPYPLDTWNLLRGQSRQGLSFGAGEYGIQGENTPGIVAVQKDSSSNSQIRYRIEFRNMRTTTASGPELRQIDMQASGATSATGDVTIQMTNRGSKTDSGDDAFEISGGEDLRRTRNIVEIDLR